jgi:aminomethyltransferase
VILRNTGELPIEISGPDAERLLNRVFTREIGKVKTGRCSYQFACYHDGGMITDGVLLRLADDRFWMAQADGNLFSWYKASAEGLDVQVRDPNVWVSQIQGPHSLEVLSAAIDGNYPDRFNYFDCCEVTIAEQRVVISRSGFTNELGWEIYLPPEIDYAAVGDRLLEAGRRFDMLLTATPVFRARRIEAGLLNAGSDFDDSTTPYDAGLGGFVDLDKPDFIGREALLNATKDCRTWGMKTVDGVARLGRRIQLDGQVIGRVCSSSWSPYLQCGVAIVRMDNTNSRPDDSVQVDCIDEGLHDAMICRLPMYDEKREIPRGLKIDIPRVA